MKNRKVNINYVMTLILIFQCIGTSFAQENKLAENWLQYANVEDAGFSEDALSLLDAKLDTLNTASLLVVYKGNILLSHGDNTRRFMIHSIRKSMMNAMIGIEEKNESLRLNQTLSELNIDDIGSLTDEEKEATIEDLLSARSGVYHPASYSTRGMIKNLPDRGSHSAGSFWYYNNWDFNVLLSIYEQQTGKLFFKAFKDEIADPLGMEDFRLEDCLYKFELNKSNHPAYLFRMSARDMARFGLLYLRRGAWEGQQLIPDDWIEKSTASVSKDLGEFSQRGGYGLLWWTTSINDTKMYYASGSGGHRIMVLPEEDLVIVHRVNTYENKNVSAQEINEIVALVLDSKEKEVRQDLDVELISYTPQKVIHTATYLNPMTQYFGSYRHKYLGEMLITKDIEGYELQTGIGNFQLIPTSAHSFFVEDIDIPLVLEKETEGKEKFTIESKFDETNALAKVIFYY